MIAISDLYSFTPDHPLRTCSANDLIVLKAFADRSRDWLDIETILSKQKKKFDQKYIIEQLTPLYLAKERPEIVVKLTQLFQLYG